MDVRFYQESPIELVRWSTRPVPRNTTYSTVQRKPIEVTGGAIVCDNTVGRNAVVAAREDDVPDRGVWMGGRLSGMFEGRTWE